MNFLFLFSFHRSFLDWWYIVKITTAHSKITCSASFHNYQFLFLWHNFPDLSPIYCDTCPNTTKNLFYPTIWLWLSSGKDLTCALDIISDKTLRSCACNLVIKLVVKTWNSESFEFCNIITILMNKWSVHNHKSFFQL